MDRYPFGGKHRYTFRGRQALRWIDTLLEGGVDKVLEGGRP